MPILNDIRATLDTALNAASGLPSIAFENAPFDQVAGTPHLRTQFFLTSRRPAVRGPNPQHRYQGLYQVTVAVPSDTGTGTALEYADLILTEFDGSSDVVGADVTVSIEYAETGTQVFDEPFYLLPVQIAWYVYAD
jgi:hypothetical protein